MLKEDGSLGFFAFENKRENTRFMLICFPASFLVGKSLLIYSCNWLGLQSLTSVENSNFSQRFIDCQNFSPAMPRSICRLFSQETQD
jgi:hypothetical protein